MEFKTEIELNKTYTYECDATFGTLSQEKVNKLETHIFN